MESVSGQSYNSGYHSFTGASGFSKDDEQYEMLHLLSNFLYFGTREIKELLRATYRDLFRRRLIHQLRRASGDTTDHKQLDCLFRQELEATKFLPVGNPSESSSHLLYYFRQENGLPVRFFISPYQMVEYIGSDVLRDPSVSRYVFLDDFAGSGDQALECATKMVGPIRQFTDQAQFYYFVLFASSTALQAIRGCGAFDVVDCVVEIGDEHQAFSEGSVYYMVGTDGVCKGRAEAVARYYGETLSSMYPLGYRDGQLIIGFAHNVPDNSLPIFWFSDRLGVQWVAPFVRYPKF